MPTKFHKPKRVVEPELLDSLPHDDPAAIRSRRDLRLINALMANKRWILSQLAGLDRGELDQNWELGAGDGTLGAAIAGRFGPDSFGLTALDLSPRSPAWPDGWAWEQADILEVAASNRPADLVVANLILHHFQDGQLGQLGQWLAGAKKIVAVEPLRASHPHVLAYALRLLGINYVTREDIHTSIDAGFRGEELPELLGLSTSDWKINISTTALGAYRMTAHRRA